MNHLTNINDIEQTIADHRLFLFYIKAPAGWWHPVVGEEGWNG